MSRPIEHTGIVERIDGRKITVVVEQQSACAACHAKGLCSEQGSRKVIEADSDTPELFSIGDTVRVALVSNRMALQSVVWGYILPFVVLIVALVVAKILGATDGIAALATLLSVALYYVVLYTLRHYFERNIKFTITKE
ncbi:MAG: SoxR reducing system RseC family protein [Alistipes sp.]|nr:SoxR reducing system RseC family protein [Alistipes sp.]